MIRIAADRLAEVFVEVADTLVDEFDLIEFLQMVTTRAAELLDASRVGIMLSDPQGTLQFMAASHEDVKLLELFQVQNQEGPCQDCFRTGSAIVDPDLARADARWPLFAQKAVALGFYSVHAVPLRLRAEVIGALNVFGSEVGTLAPSDLSVVQALADVTTIGLLQERTIHRREVLTEQLQGALNSRIVIEQAKGAVAQLHQVNVDEAFDLIRGYARRNNLKLGVLANTLLTADGASLPDLTEGAARTPPGR